MLEAEFFRSRFLMIPDTFYTECAINKAWKEERQRRIYKHHAFID